MKYREVHACVPFAVVACCLVASADCRPPSADRGDPSGADSSRRVGAQRNRSSAGQTIDFEESERRKYTRVEHMIQARFAGVQVVSSGGGFAIKIRGTGSFSTSNEPLIVVDGSIRASGALNRISPLDVERIEILKDGTASFYGARGANGVILITTRRAP
jgi:TonB-dependent SusC/RagA subfamily outer membrane receptor